MISLFIPLLLSLVILGAISFSTSKKIISNELNKNMNSIINEQNRKFREFFRDIKK